MCRSVLAGLCDAPALPNGTVCDDGLNTTRNDVCALGVCSGTPLCAGVVCPPPAACYVLGTCVPDTGRCTAPVVTDGTSCNDGNPQTVGDVCTAGTCAGVLDLCQGVTCTVRDCNNVACNGSTGHCAYTMVSDGVACAGGIGRCAAGTCSTCATDCKPTQTCEAAVCLANGTCSRSLLAAGSACDDGLDTTRDDVCDSTGTCSGTPKCGNVVCPTPAVCSVSLGCLANRGVCQDAVVANGTVCDDGDYGTIDTTCQGSVCVGRTNPCLFIRCRGPTTCEIAGGCVDGKCVFTTRDNGGACDDGTNTTMGDTCQDGVCIGTDPCDGVTCEPVSPCVTAPACIRGVCPAGSALVDGTTCVNAAGRSGTCQTGSCTLPPSDPCAGVVCRAQDLCHSVGACSDGVCSNPVVTDGASCGGNNTCTAGVCQAPDACASTTCDPASTCRHAGLCNSGVCFIGPARNEGRPCDDGDAGTSNEKCVKGVCTGTDACAGISCAGATPCRAADVCAAGRCISGAAAANRSACVALDETGVCVGGVCQLGNPCLGILCPAVDQCYLRGVCVVSRGAGQCTAGEPKPDGSYCDDGDSRTSNDACVRGSCVGTCGAEQCSGGCEQGGRV